MSESTEKDRTQNDESASVEKHQDLPQEHGGPKGPEPTRYGDWESGGKCVDF